MRAFLAVAVLAASCTARIVMRTEWEGLKRRMSEGAAPTSDDVELMLNRIEDVPAARGEVLIEMMRYVHAKKDTDGQLSSSYIDDPLISRLHEVETFESLLDMAVSERNRCERAKACDEDFLRFVHAPADCDFPVRRKKVEKRVSNDHGGGRLIVLKARSGPMPLSP